MDAGAALTAPSPNSSGHVRVGRARSPLILGKSELGKSGARWRRRVDRLASWIVGGMHVLALALALNLVVGWPIITGRVLDAVTHEPVAGVSVRVLGTRAGTVTGADGAFSIDA